VTDASISVLVIELCKLVVDVAIVFLSFPKNNNELLFPANASHLTDIDDSKLMKKIVENMIAHVFECCNILKLNYQWLDEIMILLSMI
jgi:hypothetical protein